MGDDVNWILVFFICVALGAFLPLIIQELIKKRIFTRLFYWFKKVFSKISTWFIRLRPVSKVSVCFVVAAIIFSAIFFSPTQRAHRNIRQDMNLTYANPEFEIVEFGKLRKCDLIIYCTGDVCVQSASIPTNIKAMLCKYRIKERKGWEWDYTSFYFQKNMKVDWGAIWFKPVKLYKSNDNNTGWIVDGVPILDEMKDYRLSRRQKRKIQKATEEILSEINKSWNNICVVRDYNGGYVIRERHLVMEYWIYTHNSTWTEIDMPLH